MNGYRGGIQRPPWACDSCKHAINKQLSRNNHRVMTCICALTGRTYGNVIKCPYKEDKDA